MRKLPKILEREPLVEVVFEVRLLEVPPLSEILPGALFGAFSPRPAITRLPAAALPFPLRTSDPNLQFAPVVQLDLGGYLLSVGDRNFIINCKLPYPKWAAFRSAIIDVVEKVAAVDITGSVERYSLKYTNLVEAESPIGQIAKIDMSVRLGDLDVLADDFSLQVRRQERDILHIISITTGAEGQMPDGRQVRGVVVDVDSIRLVTQPSIAGFAAGLGPSLEELRIANKKRFFECLKQETIDEMGPIYE